MDRNKLYSKRYFLIAAAIPVIAGIVIGTRAIVIAVKRSMDIAQIERRYPEAVITPSGLRYVITEEGTGPRPIAGRPVWVNYTGTLLNGQVFDSTDFLDRALEFTVGVGNAIPGFDEAVMGMREGERRIVIIPPELAYGGRTLKNVPGHSFLIFDMELFRLR